MRTRSRKKKAPSRRTSRKARAPAPVPVESEAERVFAAVEKKAAAQGLVLRPGVGPRILGRVEAQIGHRLPEDLRGWFRRHDGSTGFDPHLFPLEMGVRHARLLSGLEPHHLVLAGLDDDVEGMDLRTGQLFAYVSEEGPRPLDTPFLDWLASFTWKHR
jgi:hypothetical protein